MKPWLGIGTLLVLLGSVSGCGSSSGTTLGTAPSPSAVTRETEPQFSRDALILAASASEDGWIPTDLARQIENDLQRIRARFPALSAVHARPSFDLKSLLIGVDERAGWQTAWRNGNVATGVPALDTLLTRYKANQVRFLVSSGQENLYVLRFADPLNTEKLMAPLTASHPGLVRAERNGLIGDGDRLTRTTQEGNTTYVFSRGWGDCPAGCIRRHNWSVTLFGNGEIGLVESGSPLP